MGYKLKNKSSAKKRFSFTSTGKIKITQAGKRHNMRKLSNKQVRNKRGTKIAAPANAVIIKKYLHQ